jgi:hypothetical protein
MPQTKKQRLLNEAVALYGAETLAAGLHVDPVVLGAWIDGRAVMPDRMLQTLADLLVSLTRDRT